MVSSKDETQIQISVWVGNNQRLHCSTYVRWDFQNARSWGQIRDWYNCQLLVAFESEAISYIIAFPWYIVIKKLWAIMLLLLLFLLKSKLVFVHANFSFPWHKRPEKYFLLIGRFVKLLCDVVNLKKLCCQCKCWSLSNLSCHDTQHVAFLIISPLVINVICVDCKYIRF